MEPVIVISCDEDDGGRVAGETEEIAGPGGAYNEEMSERYIPSEVNAKNVLFAMAVLPMYALMQGSSLNQLAPSFVEVIIRLPEDAKTPFSILFGLDDMVRKPMELKSPKVD